MADIVLHGLLSGLKIRVPKACKPKGIEGRDIVNGVRGSQVHLAGSFIVNNCQYTDFCLF